MPEEFLPQEVSLKCTSCGSNLPIRAAYCPTCGAVTPYNVSCSGVSLHDLTVASSSSGAPLQAPPPPTDYGSPPYGVPPQNPYEPLNPYEVPPLPPPPPPSHRPKLGLLIGIVVLVLLIMSVSVVAVLTQQSKNTPTGYTSLPTATSAQINSTAPATPSTITATSTANVETIPYPPYSGMLVLNDPLRDNSKGYSWQETSDKSGSCAFTGGAYHAKTLGGGYYYPCIAQNTDFDNFVYEVQMKIMKGDCGAILFRAYSSVTNFYYFRMCQDGTSALFLYSNNTSSTLILSHSNSAIHAGLNQSNLVAVVAQGSTLDLYINQQEDLDRIGDYTYSHGQIAVVADGFPGNHPTEVVYSNAKVWKL